jgi:catechol 2,3-dioxygenase-like lactoylglutathione lyase family enzyme
MFSYNDAFSSFSVNDLAAAKEFYGSTLGLDVSETPEGLSIRFTRGGNVFIYPKPDHAPAAFTVLNFKVENIDDTVRELRAKGIKFESFSGDIETDQNSVFRGRSKGKGPDIAWFKDPAGNFLSILTPADR